MSEKDERLARIEQKVDDIHEFFFKWTDKHDTLHSRISVGLFLLLVSIIAGVVL